MPEPSSSLPSSAKVVIIGGGIMGCGLAYHLAHEGWRDVVLLEKGELTSGSTWHAAGQITQSTSSYALGKCVDYNIGLYSGALEAETGQSVTWHGCGSFRLAYTEDEMDWLRLSKSVGVALGFEGELVGPERVRALHPFYNLDGVLGALHTPNDGHADPSGITMALAIGARQQGAKIIRHCRASDITQQPSGAWKVSTPHGDILCEHVVNAGGTYARQMGEWSGVTIPTTSMTHHYFVTDTVPEFRDLDTELPVIRDDRHVSGYIRMEQKSGLIGIYEKANPNTVWEDHCPWEAENHLFEADYDRVMPWLAAALERMPVLAERGIKRDVHGAISHPPDGNPLIGPAPGVRNYWCCCGCQIGIGWGPGLTRELARWMVHGAADISMRAFDPRRFGPYADKDWQIIKAKEDYLLRHEIPYPHFNRLEGRPVKPSPFYERLKAKGAVFEEIYGHERPRWFARDGLEPRDYYSFRQNEVHDMVARECAAVRAAAGIMDISAFTKIEVAGQGAADFLTGLIANNLPKNDGGICLTHMLNERGRIEMEMTIVRLAADRFYLTCAAFFEQRLLDHLARYRGADEGGAEPSAIDIINRSNSWAALALQGPKSRDILGMTTSAALSNATFKWLTAQIIEVAGRRLWAFRISYAGELGWELHGARADMLAVYDALWAAGAGYGLTDYGSFAMNALRMEKMFPGAGELTNEVTLPEANVMRFVKIDKGDFIGRMPTIESLQSGALPWLCSYLVIEPVDSSSDAPKYDGHGGEAVLLGDEVVGTVSSIAFGHSVQKLLAFAYIKPHAAGVGQALDVMINAQRCKAEIRGEAIYDPQSERPRMDG